MKDKRDHPLHFSQKELNGLLVLSLLSVLFLIMSFNWAHIIPDSSHEGLLKEAEAFAASQPATANKEYEKYPRFEKKYNPTIALQPFNPNALNHSGWMALGFSDKQAAGIMKYVDKGGRFKKKEDLQKLYAMTDRHYETLEPFIRITDEQSAVSELVPFTKPKAIVKSPLKNPPVEINTADSVQLVSIRGIGPAFASRIMKYRNRLGGFHRSDQLLEVFGLDSTKLEPILPQLTVNSSMIQTTDINTADFNALKRYPYLSYKQINTILNYRKQHGPFKTPDDVLKTGLPADEQWLKLKPYLRTEP